MRPVLALMILAFLATPTFAQTKKAKPKKTTGDGGNSRGTKQVAGGDGLFGVIYTLQSGFNFTILSARYTLEPHNDYNGTMALNNEKLFWITFAIKNSDKAKDNSWGTLNVTVVDEEEQNYTPASGSVKLTSKGRNEFFATLKPGQGMGQIPEKDELSCAIAIPAKAKIKKIILNEGRLNIPGEKVVRYSIAGYPGGSPKNTVAPLPKYAADAADASGATLAVPATAVPATFYPAGYFAIRFDSMTTSEEAILNGQKPDEGKHYVILTFTAKNITLKEAAVFDLAGQSEEITLRDADGEKYTSAVESGYALRKAKRDEPADSGKSLEVGEEMSYRYIFLTPKDAKPASITFGQGKYGHPYKLDLTAVH